MQFFSDGVSEEIIQRLARGTQLRVISRTTSFPVSAANEKPRRAQRLNCAYVLDGSIRRAAGQVRISAHLMEAASGTTLWSDRYDRALEGIFEVQDDIRRKHRTARPRPRLLRCCDARAVDPAVYDLYPAIQPQVLCAGRVAHQRRRARGGDAARHRTSSRPGGGSPTCAASCTCTCHSTSVQPVPGTWFREASARAGRSNAQNNDALVARCFVVPPFGRFVEAEDFLARLRQAPGFGRRTALHQLAAAPDRPPACEPRRGPNESTAWTCSIRCRPTWWRWPAWPRGRSPRR